MKPSTRPPAIEIRGLTTSYGAARILDGLELAVASGTITALLGPSGCGKTTVLRSVAGFVLPDAGTIAIDGRDVTGPGINVPARSRRIGYVSQEGALFPHRDVAANIAFGLPRSGVHLRSTTNAARIDELLELVGLDRDVRDRPPHQLSGGQQQRVALARALAPRPDVMLLDEPFSSLDAQLRAETGRATISALRTAGVSAVLVTHDPNEALSLADSVAVLHGGVVAQHASPAEIYHHPVSVAVARALGHANLISAVVTSGIATTVLGPLPTASSPDGPAELVIRPEQLQLARPGVGDTPRGMVVDVAYYGHDCVVRIRLDDPTALVTARIDAPQAPRVGDRVGVTVVGAIHSLAVSD